MAETTIQEVTADLKAEMETLEAIIARLPAESWELRTHAEGWAVRDQVAHLAQLDEVATLAIRDAAAFEAQAKARPPRPSGDEPYVPSEPAYLVEARTKSPKELLDWWQRASSELVAAASTLDAKRRMPWYGPPMSPVSFITARLMECWSHGLDVIDVVGADRAPSARLRHIAFLGVRTRNYSYATRGLEPNTEPIRVELFGPDGETWLFGEPTAENQIKGAATDFCQVVTQRRHVADTNLEVTGPAANEWMLYAQAFAGPPGAGRKPGQFPRPAPLFHP